MVDGPGMQRVDNAHIVGDLPDVRQFFTQSQAGLALGAWGAVQATAVGVAMALSGAVRDLVNVAWEATNGLWGLDALANGYFAVYAIEMVLLVVTLIAAMPLLRDRSKVTDATTGSLSHWSGEM